LRVAWAMPAPLAKMGKSALILRVLCTRKISALNEKCTSGMLPLKLPNLRKVQDLSFSTQSAIQVNSD
jgi:hypothetical protein